LIAVVFLLEAQRRLTCAALSFAVVAFGPKPPFGTLVVMLARGIQDRLLGSWHRSNPVWSDSCWGCPPPMPSRITSTPRSSTRKPRC